MKDHLSTKRSIILPPSREADWRKSLITTINQYEKGPIEIDCQDWLMKCRDLIYLNKIIESAGLAITIIKSSNPETVVSATSLGHQAHLTIKSNSNPTKNPENQSPHLNQQSKLLFHQGTLRAGEHLIAEGDVLLLGDVNPGAKISAGGDVMVWGRLRGTAHAGKSGNTAAKITALELRPLQLRIATCIARGPEEKPQPGLAEQANIEGDGIIIQPAKTTPVIENKLL